MVTCIFCGTHDPVHYKELPQRYVVELMHRQRHAGICEPVLNFMLNLTAPETVETTRCVDIDKICEEVVEENEEQEEQEEQEEEEQEEDEEGNEDILEMEDGGVQWESCMCCYYWVTRRKNLRIVPLPMQNLLWFVRVLKWCNGSKCDSRIILRLLCTVTEPNNMYSHLFASVELEGMRAICAEIKQRQEGSSCRVIPESALPTRMQGDAGFCVKSKIAAMWDMHNGVSLLLAHSHAAELLR